MFEATQWSLNGVQGKPTEVSSPDGSRRLVIVKKNEFDHAKATMSVIVRDQEGVHYVFCKVIHTAVTSCISLHVNEQLWKGWCVSPNLQLSQVISTLIRRVSLHTINLLNAIIWTEVRLSICSWLTRCMIMHDVTEICKSGCNLARSRTKGSCRTTSWCFFARHMWAILQQLSRLELVLAGLQGSFEKVGHISLPSSLPANFMHEAQALALEGCYVLGVSMKTLGKIRTEEALIMPRDKVEDGLSFIALMAFRNELKHDTRTAILEMKEGNVRPVMITGGIYSWNCVCWSLLPSQL